MDTVRPRRVEAGTYARPDRRRPLAHRFCVLVGAMAGTALLVGACGRPSPPQSVAHLGATGPTTTTVPAAGPGPLG